MILFGAATGHSICSLFKVQTHHENCVGNSGEGLSVGQFSDPVHINAPLVNIIQNLKDGYKNIKYL